LRLLFRIRSDSNNLSEAHLHKFGFIINLRLS